MIFVPCFGCIRIFAPFNTQSDQTKQHINNRFYYTTIGRCFDAAYLPKILIQGFFFPFFFIIIITAIDIISSTGSGISNSNISILQSTKALYRTKSCSSHFESCLFCFIFCIENCQRCNFCNEQSRIILVYNFFSALIVESGVVFIVALLRSLR